MKVITFEKMQEILETLIDKLNTINDKFASKDSLENTDEKLKTLSDSYNEHGPHIELSFDLPKPAENEAQIGTSNNAARADHVHPLQTSVLNAETAAKLTKSIDITIGNNKKSFDGSNSISWTLNEMGAAKKEHTHDFSPSNHNHDNKYEKIGHNHDNTYEKIGHNHDNRYEKIGHNHSYNDLTDLPDLSSLNKSFINDNSAYNNYTWSSIKILEEINKAKVDVSNKQDKTDNNLSTTNKTITGAINELKTNKQDKTDNNLSTTNKTIIGAINELKTKVDETFQEVDSGKTLIAAAIDDPSVTKYSTFIAMSEAIADLKNSAGRIDIVCATSLPGTVVENQIVIITSNVPSVKEMRDYANSTPTSNGEIIIGISTTKDNNSMIPYSTTINNTVLTLYLDIATGKFNDKLETYDGYIGRNGKWLQFSVRRDILYSNGYDVMGFTNTNKWAYSSERIYFSNTSTSIDLKMKAYNGGWNDEYAYFRSSIDLTNVRQVRIVGSYNNNGAEHSGVGFVNSNSFTIYPTWAKKVNLTSSVKEVITDVSSLKGKYYFGTVNRCDSTARNAMRITEFELIY